MGHTVVVLGGSYAGLHIAHKLLKYTRPQHSDLKVILVSKSDHFYWNLASVRGIVPGVLQDEQLFQPIAPGFASYPEGSFELVVGSASSLDPRARVVDVTVDAADGSQSMKLTYDYLVLATGARSVSDAVPWKNAGTYDQDLQALHAIAERVGTSKTIAVGGAGSTGVEVAGELAYEFGTDKEVTLISSTPEILAGDAIASRAEKELVKLGVKVIKGAQVTGTAEIKAEAGAAAGGTEVSLSDGQKLMVDLYLSTTGLQPNSDYLDPEMLTEHKYLAVDEYYRAKGHDNIWGCGDLVSVPKASYPITERQAAGVYKNVDAAINGGKQIVVKTIPVDVLLCSTGRGRGAGRLGVVKLPSIMIWGIKGRTLATEILPTLDTEALRSLVSVLPPKGRVIAGVCGTGRSLFFDWE